MNDIDIAFIGGSGLYKIPNLKKFQMDRCQIQFANPHPKFVLVLK